MRRSSKMYNLVSSVQISGEGGRAHNNSSDNQRPPGNNGEKSLGNP